MNYRNAALARSYGAPILVLSSYIFKSDDVDRAIKELEGAVAALCSHILQEFV
jgi:pentose-5-phosphate-3-epimerase